MINRNQLGVIDRKHITYPESPKIEDKEWRLTSANSVTFNGKPFTCLPSVALFGISMKDRAPTTTEGGIRNTDQEKTKLMSFAENYHRNIQGWENARLVATA